MERTTPDIPTAEQTREEDHEQKEERVKAKAGDAADAYRQEAGRAGERASEAIEEARARGSRMVDEAKQSADEAMASARQSAADAAARARRKGETLLTDQKDQAAGKMADVESALRRAADKLYDEEDASLASFADGAAEQVGAVAGYLRDNDLRGLLRDAQQTARRRPELFLGGMFLVGMGIGRFLKATESSSETTGSTGTGASTGSAATTGSRRGHRSGGRAALDGQQMGESRIPEAP